MSTPTTSAAPASGWTPRRAYRDTEEGILGGVAGGLARHLGLPVLWLRAGFVVATVLSGLGLVLYVALWAVLPAGNRFEQSAPGVASATRGGRRPGRSLRLQDVGPAIALGALGIGALFTAQAVFSSGVVFWALAVGVAGLALLWWQADEAQRERWRDTNGRIDPVRLVFGGGWTGWARIVAGALLLVAAAMLVFLDNGATRSDGWGVLIAAVFLVAGGALVLAPWLHGLATDLSAEREERIRSQERADVAAHLHDSVLQTLALIQKNAGDATTVARLARAQERDLRSWLYAGDATDQSTVASALRGIAAEVEDAHGITVDVVTVGDCDVVEPVRPILAATREALVNAAKHAGTGRADVYAEITDAAVDVFVRDRGVGFDPDVLPEGRYGVRHSIVERMRRHGGSAAIRSTTGEGTEVRLHLPRTASEESHA